MNTARLVEDLQRYKNQGGTWAELSALSGISDATISRAASGKSKTSPETWEKLHQAAPQQIRPPWYTGQVYPPVGEREQSSGFSETHPDYDPHQIPVISYCSAGEPFDLEWTDAGLPVGGALEWYETPAGMKAPEGMYALKVRGRSMTPLLKANTVLFVDPTSLPVNGDLVVIKDKNFRAWVKIVQFHGRQIILKSLHPDFDDMITAREDLLLLHRVRWIEI